MDSPRSSDIHITSQPRPERKRSGRNSFLNKLRDILNNSSLSEIICWSGDGDRFDILDSERLQSEVIPRFFKHKNLKSFVRQLNLHGFKKIRMSSRTPETKGVDSYRHTLFRKHQPDLLNFIKRKVTKPVEPDDKSEQINYLLEQKRRLEEKCSKVKEEKDTDLLKIIGDCQKTESGRFLINAMKIYLQYSSENQDNDSSSEYVHSLTKDFINNLISIGKTKGADDCRSLASAPTTADSESLGKRTDALEREDYNDCPVKATSEGVYCPEFVSAEESLFNLDYQDEDQCIASGEFDWHLLAGTIAK